MLCLERSYNLFKQYTYFNFYHKKKRYGHPKKAFENILYFFDTFLGFASLPGNLSRMSWLFGNVMFLIARTASKQGLVCRQIVHQRYCRLAVYPSNNRSSTGHVQNIGISEYLLD